MVVVHLTSSTFFGGPERQMLGLAEVLPAPFRSAFVSFSEGGRCRAFLDVIRQHGFDAAALTHDTPRLRSAVRELAGVLRTQGAAVLCCHGYKADLLGRPAARKVGIPVVAVSRGWTRENLKVRCYEALDRLALRWMDRVVCVSEGQAVKVRRAGVPADRVVVIRNAIRADRFSHDPQARAVLQGFFPRPRRQLVVAAGRLSPEKGFAVLVEAARQVHAAAPDAGFVLFGEGALREALARQIAAAGLADAFVLAGFRGDLDRLLPAADLLVLPSYTEGLPNVVLEAFAAGVPVVATAVGGTPEVVEDGRSGFLVPPGDSSLLARRVGELLGNEAQRRAMGQCGRWRVLQEFTFAAQAEQYQRLFARLVPTPSTRPDSILQRSA